MNTQTGHVVHDKKHAFEVTALGQSKRIAKVRLPEIAVPYTLTAAMELPEGFSTTSRCEIRFVVD